MGQTAACRPRTVISAPTGTSRNVLSLLSKEPFAETPVQKLTKQGRTVHRGARDAGDAEFDEFAASMHIASSAKKKELAAEAP